MKNIVNLLVLALFFLCSCSNEDESIALEDKYPEHVRTFSLSPSGKAIVNPHKGFVQYAWSAWSFNPSNKSFATNPTWEYTPVLYTRKPWNKIQTGENTFDWAEIDKYTEFCNATGRTFAFGVHICDSQAEGDYVPQYVYDKGCKYVYTRIRGKSDDITLRVPDFEDPVYLQECKRFAKVLAEKIDGNSAVEFLDIRTFGNWGEWHCYQFLDSEMPSDSIQKEMIAYYASVFKHTRLVLPVNGGVPSEDVKRFAVSKGVSLRRDGLVELKNCEMHMQQAWEANLPTVGEYCSAYTDMKKKGTWDLDYWKQIIRTAHLTFAEMPRNDCGLEFYTDYEDIVKEYTNIIGYNLTTTKAEVNLKDKTLKVTIKNTGVAPPCFDIYLSAEICDEGGNKIASIGKQIKIPKATFLSETEKTFTFNLGKSQIKEGVMICLSLYESTSQQKPSVRFDNTGNLGTNRLCLGKL